MLFQISNRWCYTFFISKIDTVQAVLEQCACQIDGFGAPRKVCGSQGASVAHTRQTYFPCFVRLMRGKSEISHSYIARYSRKPITRDLGPDTEMWVEEQHSFSPPFLIDQVPAVCLFSKHFPIYYLPCARPCSKSFTNINSFNHHGNLRRQVLLLFCHWIDVSLDGVSRVRPQGSALSPVLLSFFLKSKTWVGNTQPYTYFRMAEAILCQVIPTGCNHGAETIQLRLNRMTQETMHLCLKTSVVLTHGEIVS